MYEIEIHDVTGNIILKKEGKVICETPYHAAWRIFEAATGESFKDLMEKKGPTVSSEVTAAFYAGVQAYQDAFPDKVRPHLLLDMNSKWCYFYSAIDQPSRVAALSKEKYGEWIKELIQDSLALRERKGQIAWLTLHILQTVNTGLQSIMNAWPGKTSVYEITPNFLRRHGTFLKPGKALREFCGEPDKVNIEVFSGYFKDEMRKLEPECDRVKVSDKPGDIYIKGGSFTSCMIGKPREFFEVYDEIENCQIAYILDERENLVARALLWENVTDKTSSIVYPKVMDRIYFKTNSELATMKAWAIKNGYIFKTKQSLGHYDFYDGDMNKISLKESWVEINFTFDWNMYQAVPYVDTFAWAKEGSNKLYTYCPGGTYANMTNTDGQGGFLAEGNVPVCDDCGRVLHEDDAHYDDNGYAYCDTCWDERFAYCDRCGEYYDRDSVEEVYDGDDSEYLCECCRNRSDAWYEDWSGEWHIDGNEARLNGYTIAISDHRISGDRHHDWVMCDDCGTYFDSYTEGIDRGTECYCDECLEKRDMNDFDNAENRHPIVCPACQSDMSKITMVWIRDEIENSEIQYLCPDCAKVWKEEE